MKKRKLSKEARFNLSNCFMSLFSNKRAIEAGKSMPIWSHAIVAVLAPALALVPVIVGVARTNGDNALSGTLYGFDKSVALTMVDINNDNDELRVGEDHLLKYYKDGSEVTDTGALCMGEHINTQTQQYDIQVYYLRATDDKTVDDLYKEINEVQYVIGTTTPKAPEDESGTKYYRPHYIFFHEKAFAVNIMANNSINAAANFSGDYNHVPAGELIDRITKVNNVIPTTYEAASMPDYQKGLIENMKVFFNEAYIGIKGQTLLFSSTIYYGVYLGLVLFLGLLTFILTRSKKNFNSYLKWYQCMGIVAWASISPALLSLILGFLLASMATMLFILLLGVRVMWLTMKQLSPTYTE